MTTFNPNAPGIQFTTKHTEFDYKTMSYNVLDHTTEIILTCGKKVKVQAQDPIVYEGKKYWLIEDAYVSNSVFPNCFNDVKNGESFLLQMLAPVIDETGKKWEIEWMFEDIKGSEHDLDWFDYYDQENIRRITEAD